VESIATTVSAGACTRKSVALEVGVERGREGEFVPQQLSDAQEQQAQANTGPPPPCGAAVVLNWPETMANPRTMLHSAFTVLLSV